MDKTKQTLVIAVVAVLVVMAGGWFLLISPQRSNVATLQSETATQNATNAATLAKIQQLKAQAVEEPADLAALQAIARRLPPDLAEASLITGLSHAAAAANVNLQVITPGAPALVAAPVAPVVTTAPAATGAPGAAGSTTAPGAATGPKGPPVNPNQLYSVPLSLTVQGNYFDIEMFIHNLEGMQRAVVINNIGLVSSPPATGANATTAPTKAPTSQSKATKSGTKPVPGSPAAAQAAAQAQAPFVVDPNTLTLTLAANVYSMYSTTPLPKLTAVQATPAPTATK